LPPSKREFARAALAASEACGQTRKLLEKEPAILWCEPYSITNRALIGFPLGISVYSVPAHAS